MDPRDLPKRCAYDLSQLNQIPALNFQTDVIYYAGKTCFPKVSTRISHPGEKVHFAVENAEANVFREKELREREREGLL